MSYWRYEAALVALILCVVAILSGGHPTDWIASAAVLLTFMHGQISFDMQESQGNLAQPAVPSYKWSGRCFVAKEFLWIITFTLLHAWPLLAATIIFATYPTWRRWFRTTLCPAHVRTSSHAIAIEGTWHDKTFRETA